MTIAPPEEGLAVDQSAEPWMPNGFPPPSFVVEAERTTTFAGGRGRWLAAAAILGAVLLIAGLLLIARSGDGDRTDLATSGSTTSTVAPAPGFTPSQVDPTQGDPSANTTPTIIVDPNATTAPAAGATTTVVAAPVPGAPPPPPPGVLTPAATSVTLPTAFNPRPSTGTIELRNTGPSPLEFTTQTSTGLTATPATGAILPGASTTVTLTLNGAGIREGEYNGSVAFGGSGGTRSVQVRSVVANAPNINPAVGGRYAYPEPGQTGCINPSQPTPKWRIRAAITDSSRLDSVTARVNGTDFNMTEEKRADGKGTGIWSVTLDPLQPGTEVKFTIRAVDALRAEATTPEEVFRCP